MTLKLNLNSNRVFLKYILVYIHHQQLYTDWDIINVSYAINSTVNMICNTSFIFILWWRHQMETFSALLAFVKGIHWSPMDSPHKGQWRRTLMFSLICAWTNAWANNRDADDLRHHRAHYDVTVIYLDIFVTRGGGAHDFVHHISYEWTSS